MTEISEEFLVAEARVAASEVVTWFRERLLTAQAQRSHAIEGRVAAENDRRVADEDRMEAERRVIKVEQLLVASEELAEQLQQALASRIVIEQAKGFLAARHGVTTEAAFEAMRRHARGNGAPLRHVAGEVMAGTLHLEL